MAIPRDFFLSYINENRKDLFLDYLKRLDALDVRIVRHIVLYAEKFAKIGTQSDDILNKNPNRKIYAVAKPTKEELLQRLIYLIESLDEVSSVLLMSNLSNSIILGEFAQTAFDLFAKGEISQTALEVLASKEFCKEMQDAINDEQ